MNHRHRRIFSILSFSRLSQRPCNDTAFLSPHFALVFFV